MVTVNKDFFSDLSQAVLTLKDVNGKETELFEQAIHQCQEEQSKGAKEPVFSLEHLSQTIKDKCAHLFKAVSPLIEEELSKLNKESFRKRKPESSPTDESTEPARKRQKIEDSHLPEVQDTEAAPREIQDITDIISLLQTDHSQGIALLQTRLPEYIPPELTYTIPQNLEKAIQEQSSCLITALKTCQCALNALPKPQEAQIIQYKSELSRLLDVAHTRQVGSTPHPMPEVFLPLTEALANQWPSSHNPPLQEIPAYLFMYPHPANSTEGSNSIRIDGVSHFNTLNPWTTTLKYVEKKVLKKPLNTYTPQQLRDLLIHLHNLLRKEEEPLRTQELLVFPPHQTHDLLCWIEYFKTTEPEISRGLIEIHRLVARWGSLEKSELYFSELHWTAMRRLGYLAPAPESLDSLLNQFCERLATLFKSSTYHPYQIASFIHFGLTEIHLFGDANGRLARLFSNIYLMQQGISPFIIWDDDEYTKIACTPPKNYEQAFGDLIHESNQKTLHYLKNKILPTEKHETSWEEANICSVM